MEKIEMTATEVNRSHKSCLFWDESGRVKPVNGIQSHTIFIFQQPNRYKQTINMFLKGKKLSLF